MQNENFEIIFLKESEQLLLEQAINMGVVLTYPAPSHLLTLGLLNKIDNNSSNQYVITDRGSRYIEYLQQKEKQKLKDTKLKIFQFWFSIVITNLISFALLIVSIIALTKK